MKAHRKLFSILYNLFNIFPALLLTVVFIAIGYDVRLRIFINWLLFLGIKMKKRLAIEDIKNAIYPFITSDNSVLWRGRHNINIQVFSKIYKWLIIEKF